MTEQEVMQILNQERLRKNTALAIIEEIEYERGKSIKAVTYDQVRVQGGRGASANPFLHPTAKILQLEKRLEQLDHPSEAFDQLINQLPGLYKKIVVGYYSNHKTHEEIRGDIEQMKGRLYSVSAIQKWKREAIKLLATELHTASKKRQAI